MCRWRIRPLVARAARGCFSQAIGRRSHASKNPTLFLAPLKGQKSPRKQGRIAHFESIITHTLCRRAFIRFDKVDGISHDPRATRVKQSPGPGDPQNPLPIPIDVVGRLWRGGASPTASSALIAHSASVMLGPASTLCRAPPAEELALWEQVVRHAATRLRARCLNWSATPLTTRHAANSSGLAGRGRVDLRPGTLAGLRASVGSTAVCRTDARQAIRVRDEASDRQLRKQAHIRHFLLAVSPPIIFGVWPTSPDSSMRPPPATRRPRPSCSRSSTTSCANSRPPGWPRRNRARPFSPPPSFTKRIFVSSGVMGPYSGTGAGTSSLPRPRPYDGFWSRVLAVRGGSWTGTATARRGESLR